MSTNRSTAAREIAAYINDKWGITWVSPLIVQIFIVLSNPVRNAIYAFLQTAIAALNEQKAILVTQSLKGDGLANQIAVLESGTAQALQPITQLLQVLPLDTIINESPDAQEFLGDAYQSVRGELTFDNFMDSVAKISPDFSGFINDLISFVPVKISLEAISNTFGSNYEFFDGVTNFQDLRERIEELEFRSARAAALSSYARAGSTYIDIQIQKIEVYLDVIVTINTGVF